MYRNLNATKHNVLKLWRSSKDFKPKLIDLSGHQESFIFPLAEQSVQVGSY